MRFCVRVFWCLLAWPLTAVTPTPATAQDFDAVQIKTIRVADGLHMLTGRGGNVALSTGRDGPLMIDDQFAELAPKLTAAARALQDAPLRFLLNTHHHFDHTGGNAVLADAGAVVIAHHNVRERLRANAKTPAAALPVLAFRTGFELHWNDEVLEVQHVAHAHTDGDAVIWFRHANAVHMGDLFFNGLYPFIDVDAGGSVDGLLAGLDATLARADANTRIIPGHGPLARVGDLRRYRAMVAQLSARVDAALARGEAREAFIKSAPLADLDPEWGGGFMTAERLLGLVWKDRSGAHSLVE